MTDQADRRRVCAALLRKVAAESMERSAARGAVVREQRAQRAQARASGAAPAADIPDFSVTGPAPARAPNAADVERWWRAAMDLEFEGRVAHEPWTVAQKILAKKLLGLYGAEAVERGLHETLVGWRERAAAQGLPTIPTINYVWGMRAGIWRAAAAGLEDNAGERLVKKTGRGKMKEDRRRQRMEQGEWHGWEDPTTWEKGSGW